MAVTFNSNYEYIPREIEVEEMVLVGKKFIRTWQFLFFYWWYYEWTYKKMKVKKTVYDKYKKIRYPTKFDYDLLKVTDAKNGKLVQIWEHEGRKLFEIK